jgi:hypothetical protein
VSRLYGRNGKIKIGETEIATTDWTMNLSRDYVDATSWDGTSTGYLSGLKDIHGTFSGPFSSDASNEILYGDSLTTVYLYAPARLPWYKAWWIRLRGKEWPTEVIASGPAIIDTSMAYRQVGEDKGKITGTFNSAGAWSVELSHDPSWGGYWDRLRMRFHIWRHRR